MQKLIAADDESSRQKITALRQAFRPEFFEEIGIKSREEALVLGVEIIKGVLSKVAEYGINFAEIEAGHGTGHLMRDYLHALRLMSGLQAPPPQSVRGLGGRHPA